MRRHAFTLVELLVVISILALLSGLLLGGIKTVRDSAQQSACASNLRQFGMAAIAYTSDNQGLLPTIGMLSCTEPGLETYLGIQYSTTTTTTWRDYARSQRIMACPVARKVFATLPESFTSTFGICDVYKANRKLFYRMNPWDDLGDPLAIKRLSKISPTNFLFMTCGSGRWHDTGINRMSDWSDRSWPLFLHKTPATVQWNNGPSYQTANIDTGLANTLFLDGRVSALRIWTASATTDWDAERYLPVIRQAAAGTLHTKFELTWSSNVNQ